MGWLSSNCHVLWIFVKFEACGLLTQFWFCLPFFYLKVSNEFFVLFAGSFLTCSQGFYYGGFESFDW
jgi:hypothetical protein